MAGRRAQTLAIALAMAAAGPLAACSRPAASPPTTTIAPTKRPATAEELHIVLDPDGRPYDVEVDPEWGLDSTRYERIATLHVPGGHLRVMDGSALGVDPSFFRDEAVAVEFGVRRLTVGIIWEFEPGTTGPDPEEYASVLGVRVDVPGTTVARWGPFEQAYGTDGGLGGITARSVIEVAEDGWPDDRGLLDDDQEYLMADWDDEPGDDSLIFSNGFGDGGFPMARGFDRGGRLVSLVVWDTRHPWRLAVTDGTPPPDVTEREEQLIDCMAGRRPIDQWNKCVAD